MGKVVRMRSDRAQRSGDWRAEPAVDARKRERGRRMAATK